MAHSLQSERKERSKAARVMKLIAGLVLLGVIGAGAFLYVTRPQPMPDTYWAQAGTPDVKNGALVFSMAGCVSCHAAPDAKPGQELTLSGGLALASPFGTFHVPN